jgi:hypothetical protein
MYSDPIFSADRTITGLLFIVALAHAVPAAAFFDAELLQVFYGVAADDPNLAVLLRHRALLFAIVAGILALGASRPRYRPLALTVGWSSIGSYVFLVMSITGVNALVHRVAVVDLVLGAALAIATGIAVASTRGSLNPK